MKLKYPLKMGAYGLLLKLLLNNGDIDSFIIVLSNLDSGRNGIR